MLEKITLMYRLLRARAHENARARTNAGCAGSKPLCDINFVILL